MLEKREGGIWHGISGERKCRVKSKQRGTERPYYIAKKGLRPEGVYVRQGYSSVPATDTMIRYMIKETDGDRFETMRSLEQELTFQATEKEFLGIGVSLRVLCCSS